MRLGALVRTIALLMAIAPGMLKAQDNALENARITGLVRDSSTRVALFGVSVFRDGRLIAVSGQDGRFRTALLPPGRTVLSFRRLGFRPMAMELDLRAGETREVQVLFDATPIPIGLVTVIAASRRPQRLVEAPAAITVIDPERVRDLAPLGQLPLLIADVPGVHVQQSGAYEFNLNTRGFNGTNNRRILVLVDGRDIAVPLLGNQEWLEFDMLEDAARVELVRGPGSALYGANAFGGVLAIRSPGIRDAQGLRITASGGSPYNARGDARYAAVSANGRWGVRVSGGGLEGRGWERSRTDSADLRREYANATRYTPRAPAPGYELVPLLGQTTGQALGVSAPAQGSVNPTSMYYGTARVERYFGTSRTLTGEGGYARVENLPSTVATGRSQTEYANRPWARLAFSDTNFTLFAYYNGRTGVSQSLAAPNAGRDESSTMHVEGQYDRPIAGLLRGGLFTVGASARETRVNTHGTVLSAEGDGTRTRYAALFGQLEATLTPRLRAILAARGDFGSEDATRFSPKAALVYAPRANHSIRATFAQGYLVSPPLARYLDFPAAAPLDLRLLEGGLRASPLGPALLGVPSGTLFSNSASVPVLARGNPKLVPERVNSVEIGYKGQGSALYFSADAYLSRLDDFLSQLLPGANPQYPAWTAPSAVPEVARGALEGAVASAVGSGLTRLENGNTAYVLSGGNAGRATERGAEAELVWRTAPAWQFGANYSWYSVSIGDGTFLSGDTVRANTPSNSGNVQGTYSTPGGLRMRLGLRVSEAFEWRTALWHGQVPASATVDATVSRPLARGVSGSVVVTNLLDQQRFQFFGGSLIRRRIVASLSWRQ